MNASARIAVFTALLLFAERGDDPRAQKAPTLQWQAQAHAEKGLKAYQDANYLEAIREYNIAYKIDPQSWLLYSLAQAERLAGRCERAVDLYQRYLRSEVNENQEKAAQFGIKSCKGQQPIEAEEEPLPEPQIEIEKEELSSGTNDVHHSFSVHPLAIGGLVALGIGGTLVVLAEQEVSRARDQDDRDDLVEGLNRGTYLRRVGWTVLSIGAAAVATRYLLHRREKNATRLSVAVDQEHATLVWLGQFE